MWCVDQCLILCLDFNLEWKDDGNEKTLVSSAAGEGHAHIVEYLLDKGAGKGTSTRDGVALVGVCGLVSNFYMCGCLLIACRQCRYGCNRQRWLDSVDVGCAEQPSCCG